ncbi:MAG: precorrin-6Y C5,15-methyltransferase (decarboxylating) subunit CbiT [Methanomassiliicoccales archaeon]
MSGGPTQDEIMAVSLFKLGLKKGDRFADIGCGTGKVSIEAARTCNVVYSIDSRSEAIEATRVNVSESGMDNIVIIKGSANESLPRLGPLDCAFVGGSKELNDVLRTLASIVKGRIVVNAVLLSTLENAVATMKDLGIFEEVVQMNVSRSYDLAGSVMFKPIDPVFIIVGRVN